jgi:hypothetical protein
MDEKKRKILLKKCGLPDISETKHCFADATHHTCCNLSKDAREYADRSGNPIGKLSEKVFEIENKKTAGENTTWCTCTGSKVCSYYKKLTNDKTFIKFINFIESIDEDEAIRLLNLDKHKTPGIKD